jgi:hypothetical protein
MALLVGAIWNFSICFTCLADLGKVEVDGMLLSVLSDDLSLLCLDVAC